MYYFTNFGALTKLKRIWQNRKVSGTTNKRPVQTIFLYGSGAWTVRAAERKKIDAFEMWCWRSMLRMPWIVERTNISILEQLRINTRLFTLCYKNILSYFGHIARRLSSNMDKLILVEAIKKAEDRTGWKAVVKSLRWNLNPDMTFSNEVNDDEEDFTN
ncbi:jg15831 [Pararge aegeria aegeria]|uniref:Jg15831 protein n=1 Tax=Pararge aegeria aegeria TaxID=348720 RepID=A0A8S4SLS4_9NEOP|nr:jg15831 [Pararge aegeria aegeria]